MERVIAMLLVAVYLLLAAVGVFLNVLNSGTVRPDGVLAESTVDASFAIVFAGYALAGAAIAARTRGNAVGWLLLGMALSTATAFAAEEYALYGTVTRPGSVPGTELAVWISIVAWQGLIMPLPFVIFLFPTGSLPSTRWRPVAWAIGVGVAIVMVIFAFGTAGDSEHPQLRNPFYVEALAPLREAAEASFFIFLLFFGAAVASLIVRARHARPEERQQLKWVASAAVLMLLFLIAATYLPVGGEILWPVAISSLPVAIAVAILRYRLYDIDVLINRALVYAALTAALGAAYVASVVLLQALLRPFTAGSDIAVAASTLAVVALFQPLRRRIQDAVDRRFYRSRYDAQRTLDEFSSRLRDEIDLVQLEGQLVTAVQRTVRPAHASLWLRGSER